MSKPRTVTGDIEHALQTLTHHTVQTNTDTVVDTPTVTVSTDSLAASVPQYNTHIPHGHTGIVHSNSPTQEITRVYDKQLTRELYTAVNDRVKWFTRVHITPNEADHITFFGETLCRYNSHTPTIRIPGAIRGADIQNKDSSHGNPAPIDANAYLVPVHQLPPQYWETRSVCTNCQVLLNTPRQTRDTDPVHDTRSFDCPVCTIETPHVTKRHSGVWFQHNPHNTGTESECGPVTDTNSLSEYMDWLLDITPGVTMDTPPDFPDTATTLSDGTVIDWLSPFEPVAYRDDESLLNVRPFVTVHPPDSPHPFVITHGDMNALTHALKQH